MRPLLALLLLAGCAGAPEGTAAADAAAETAERPLPPPALPGRLAGLPPPVAMPAPPPAVARPPASPPTLAGPAQAVRPPPAPSPAAPPGLPPAPRPAPDPPAAAGPETGREGPRVQIVAAGSEAEARAHWAGFVQRLPDLAEGRTPQILPFERPGQPTLWRLRLGGFASAEAAEAWCERLRARGGGCWVAR